MPLAYQSGDDALDATLRLHLHDLDVNGPRVVVGTSDLPVTLDHLRLPVLPRVVGSVLARLGREPALHDDVVARISHLRRAIRSRVGLPAGRGPRFLVRVDDYPRWDLPTSDYRRFHAALAGVPYLLAVTPLLAKDPLNPHSTSDRTLEPTERELLASLVGDGVDVALHGRTHRTLRVRPHSELEGLGEAATLRLVDDALVRLGREALGFVPPFNHFGPAEFRALARRFRVVSAGGRESVHAFGAWTSPAALGGTLYVPSYFPAYGRAAELQVFVDRLVATETEEVLIPLTLHWAWERADDFAAVATLARTIRDRVVSWRSFADEADRALARRAA